MENNNHKLTKPVFIICQHRTGSTFLKNLIDNHPDIHMVSEEMDIADPWRKTLLHIVKKFYSNVDVLLEKIYEGKFHGTYFDKKKLIDEGIDRKCIKNKIGNDVDLYKVFSAILNCILIKTDKHRIGVKFPLHWKKIHMLFNFYPDAKVIFLVRDPRAMISSKLQHRDTKRRKKQYKVISPFIHIVTVFFFVYEFITFYKTYVRNKNNKNVKLVFYENLVTEIDFEIDEILNFCDLDCNKYDYSKIIITHGQPSSTTGNIIKGQKNMNTDWQKRLTKFDKFFINLFISPIMKKYGYKN
ncbi:MAG: sulfotransferase [Candidatus Woesearchaeota archaeon]